LNIYSFPNRFDPFQKRCSYRKATYLSVIADLSAIFKAWEKMELIGDDSHPSGENTNVLDSFCQRMQNLEDPGVLDDSLVPNSDSSSVSEKTSTETQESKGQPSQNPNVTSSL
jgi:hypothetical protein